MQLLQCNSGINQFETQEMKQHLQGWEETCFQSHLQGGWCWGCRGHDTMWPAGCHGFNPYFECNFSNATLESINSKPKKWSNISKFRRMSWFWFHFQIDWCWGCRGHDTLWPAGCCGFSPYPWMQLLPINSGSNQFQTQEMKQDLQVQEETWF